MTSYLGNVIPFGPVPNASKLTGRAGTPPVAEAAPDSADDNRDQQQHSGHDAETSPAPTETAESTPASHDASGSDLPAAADARSIVEGLCADGPFNVTAMQTPKLHMLLQPRSAPRERFNPLESPEKSIQVMLAGVYSRFAPTDAKRHSKIR